MASPLGAGQPPSKENLNPTLCQIDETLQEQEDINPILSGKCEGYDCEFIERPKELQTDCPMCLAILREPFQVTCCGESFCRTCIEPHIQADKMSCPTCKQAKFDAFPNKGLRRSLYTFHVCCVHKKSGCKWTGKLGEVDRHLNLNPELSKQLIGCVSAPVACTHCCEYFQRRCVNAHQTESCPQRPFSCDYCDDYGSAYEDVVNHHWPVCKCYPVPCPNKCGANPERKNVEMHINMECPLTIVNCDFHYTGCDVQLAHKDKPTHLAESLTTHISLLTAQTQTFTAGSGTQDPLPERLLLHLSLLTLHNQQLTRLTIQQKESLEESLCMIQELKREKQAQAAKLKDISEMSKCNIEALEREKRAQVTLSAELQKLIDTCQHKIEVLENERQAQAAVNAEFRETFDTIQQNVEVLEKERQAQAAVNEEFQKTSDTIRCNVEVLENERQAQVTVNAEFRKTSDTIQHNVEVLENERQAQAAVNAEFRETFDTIRHNIEVLEKERQAQAAVNEEFQKTSDTIRRNVEVLENERQAQAAVNAEFRKTSDTIQRNVEVLENERQAQAAVNAEIHKLKQENEALKQEMAELRRNQDGDRTSLATVQRYTGVFPIKLTMTNFAEMKTNHGQWYSPAFYTHPQRYKMCLKVDAYGYGNGKGTHISVFAHLMQGEFGSDLKMPFQGHVTVAMLNQLEDNNHTIETIRFTGRNYTSTVTEEESVWGYPTFIAHAELDYNPTKNCQYLKYNCLHFEIVTVELK